MANIKYEDMLDEVLPHLAADPSDPVTTNAVKRSVIELCSGSWIWSSLPDPVDVSAGEQFYDIEADPGTDVTTVISAQFNGQPIESKSVQWLDRELPGWRVNRSTPKYFTQIDTEQIILAGIPDSNITGGLTMTIALQPGHDSKSFPKWIFNQFIYTIVDGAVSKLMLMPNKPWTDLNVGSLKAQAFAQGIANARASAVSALGSAPIRVTPQN